MTNTAIVKGLFEAFHRGDIGVVLDGLTDNVEWVINGPSSIPFAGRHIGRDGVAGFFKILAETTEMTPIQIDQYVEQADTVIALGSSAGRSKKLQKQVRTRFAMVYAMSGGKVARFEEYLDTAAVASAFVSDAQAARG